MFFVCFAACVFARPEGLLSPLAASTGAARVHRPILCRLPTGVSQVRVNPNSVPTYGIQISCGSVYCPLTQELLLTLLLLLLLPRSYSCCCCCKSTSSPRTSAQDTVQPG